MTEPAQHDPRYADVVTMYAVMNVDRPRSVQGVFATRGLAQTYIDGQWSSEYLEIEEVPVVSSLPPLRPLYCLTGRLPYQPHAVPSKQMDDFMENPGEFPGLGNGTMVPLGEIRSSLKEYQPYGWDVSAYGWDRPEVEQEFGTLMEQAVQLRAARFEAFAPYTVGALVRTAEGQRLVRVRDPNTGSLCWQTVGTPSWGRAGGVRYDDTIDPSTLDLLAAGE